MNYTDYMKIFAIIIFAMLSLTQLGVLAHCTTQPVFRPGGVEYCTTCCNDEHKNCVTICN